MANLPRSIALVYDRVNKWGGAEQVLLNLHDLFPDAPLYTAVYNSSSAEWARVFPKVIPSFLQNFPRAKSQHELYPWLTPVAFETFDFSEYDLVISVTSADAKGIITKPHTLHVCYCLTPTRYLWSHAEEYKNQLDPTMAYLSTPVFNHLKKWDQVAASRPDEYIAISKTVQGRIAKYYHRESEVIYPPVDVDFYSAPAAKPSLENFFLYVGRLVAYKQAQILVETFNDLRLPLAIIGRGAMEDKLKQMARENIYFFGGLTNQELASYYQHAKALLFYHEEDFGIVPVEAMAGGTPVIGLNKGGVSETVIHNVTGQLIGNSIIDLKNTIINFNKNDFDATVVRQNARNFSKDIFKKKFLAKIEELWRRHKTISMS